MMWFALISIVGTGLSFSLMMYFIIQDSSLAIFLPAFLFGFIFLIPLADVREQQKSKKGASQ